MTTHDESDIHRPAPDRRVRVAVRSLPHARSADFLDNNRNYLHAQYPDQWIAVESDKVLGNSPRLEHLVRTLTEMHADPQAVVIEFIRKRESGVSH
jgi:hypothetical protein